MQRWMLWAVLAAVGMALLGGGAFYARKQYYANKPDKIWVPLPLRADLSMAEQKDLAEEVDADLRKDERLREIVADLGLKGKFNVADEDAAVKELDRRLFVEVGMADTPGGRVPSINVGVRGISREKVLLHEMTERIINDVLLMIGVDPNTGKREDDAETLDAPGDL